MGSIDGQHQSNTNLSRDHHTADVISLTATKIKHIRLLRGSVQLDKSLNEILILPNYANSLPVASIRNLFNPINHEKIIELYVSDGVLLKCWSSFKLTQ